MDAAADPDVKPGWGLVFGSALALTVCTGPVIQFSFAVFMKPVADGLATDRGTLALAPALGLLLVSLVTPIVGLLIDRLGLRRIVPLSVVLTAIGLALLGMLSNSVPLFITLYGLTALTGAGYGPLPFAKAVSARFQTRRGLALGITMAGVGIGTALVPPLAQAAITAFGWRTAYLALAAGVLAVALPPTLLTLPDLRANRVPTGAPLKAGAAVGEAMRSATFWKLAISFASMGLATAGIITHMAALLSDRGISAGYASTALSVGGIALIAGRLLSGYMLDKIFAPLVAFAFFAAALGGIALLLLSDVPALAWVSTGLVGLSLGAEVDLIAYLLCRYFGQRAFGAIYGYLFAAFTLGTAFGPLLMGVSFARTGGYEPAMLGFAALVAMACLLVSRLGSYLYQADGRPVAPSPELQALPV
jgi:predicted MFS family arabinose efflux permease